jgi:hypothetical protein
MYSMRNHEASGAGEWEGDGKLKGRARGVRGMVRGGEGATARVALPADSLVLDT